MNCNFLSWNFAEHLAKKTVWIVAWRFEWELLGVFERGDNWHAVSPVPATEQGALLKR